MAFPKCIYLQGRVSNYICVFVCGVWKFSKPQQAAGINNCHSWRTILHLVNATLPERKKTNRKNFPLDVLHTVRARAKWKGANNESFARSESERLKTKWKEKKNVLFLFTFPVAMFRYNCFFFCTLISMCSICFSSCQFFLRLCFLSHAIFGPHHLLEK